MRDEYDFENAKGRKNPHARKLKKQITIRLDPDVIDYFKAQADETGISYQTLINLYLRDWVDHRRTLTFDWGNADAG